MKVVAIIPYLLTPRCAVLLDKLTGSQPVKKFPAFGGTRRFITAFTSARHLSYPEPHQSSPCLPTQSNLHLPNSLTVAVSEPALYTLLIFQVPNMLY